MKAKVARWGNSLAVRLPAEVVRDLGFEEGQVVEITSQKERLEVVLKREGRRHTASGIPIYTPEELLADMDRLGPEAVPAMVDWGGIAGRRSSTTSTRAVRSLRT